MLVAGRVLMRDRQVLTIDETAILTKAQSEAEAVAQRVAADPVHKNIALLAAMQAGQMEIFTQRDGLVKQGRNRKSKKVWM